jgi:hypothetical protein
MARTQPLEKFHIIQHPDRKRRVEFFRTNDRTWTFAQSTLSGRRWIRTSQLHGAFRTYNAALVEAGRELPWIVETLSQAPCGWVPFRDA